MTTWRVGRKLGRTIYKDDVCVGMVDTPAIAERIVTAMNAAEPSTHASETRVPRSDPHADTCECGSRGTLHMPGCQSADAARVR
jgi:hypothetical protein